MARNCWIGLAMAMTAALAAAQSRQPRIQVEHYLIEAEIDPRAQTLSAKTTVRFTTEDEYTSSAEFELNNALNVSKVEDAAGQEIPYQRNPQNFTVMLTFPQALSKGQTATAAFTYQGRLSGIEDSPVFGVKFAAIHPDFGYLLYPSRWYPLNGYSVNRHTAEMRITVPAGYKVIASGLGRPENLGEKVLYRFETTRAGFPGSIGVVQGDPTMVPAQGIDTAVYFRGEQAQLAAPYGQETAKVMTYLTSVFGLPPQANLTLIQTEDGAPNGYAAPGVLFLAPHAIGRQPNVRLLANQVARQWWGQALSAATRNHLWLTNGMARYAEVLYLEHVNGASALDSETHDIYVDALTVTDVPISQTPRIEDYSPEFWALTASKGSAVMNMLRYILGDANFGKLLLEFLGKYQWQSVRTDDFRKAAEAVGGQNLQYFFLQWIESAGAPEFKLEYTIYRTQKGFRVMGKVSQDLDTFRMPVELKIETEGNPEQKTVDVVGTSSEFVVDTFGKPKALTLDPNHRVLRFSDPVRVAVAIRRGEQFAEISEFNEAILEYQKALEVNRNSSLAHYRIAEVFFLQNNFQSAANEFREALNGDLDPKWTEVWAHLNLGKIFDMTGQRERAVSEYTLALRTKDNTQGAQEMAAKYLKTPYERTRSDS